MSEYVYLNDDLIDADGAAVSVHDAGLLHGVGLFSTMRAYGGRVFRLGDHLERLFNSAAALNIVITQPREQIERALAELIQANGLSEARVRLTVTRGNIRILGDVPPRSTLLITAGPMQPYPEEFYRKGMTVIVSPYKQNPDDPTAGHKTTNYFPRLIALQQAQGQTAGEALWFNTGNRLAEGCVSNIFIVHEGKLLTPPVNTPVLPGIARKVVLELAEREGIAHEERPIVIKELLAASEVFLTNSIMEVMPVCRIERHAVGDEKPGPLYQKLHELYKLETRI